MYVPVAGKVITNPVIPWTVVAPNETAAGKVSVCATLAIVTIKRILPPFPDAGQLLNANVLAAFSVAVWIIPVAWSNVIVPPTVPNALTTSALFFINASLIVPVKLKSFTAPNVTEVVCNASISVFADVKFVFIFVKLSLNPWLSLSCPATGYVPSILLGFIELAIYSYTPVCGNFKYLSFSPTFEYVRGA